MVWLKLIVIDYKYSFYYYITLFYLYKLNKWVFLYKKTMFNTFKTNLTILIDSLRGIDDVNHSKLK